MNIHERCPICPVEDNCPSFIKKYNLENGARMTIMGTPVVCPGPESLIEIVGRYGRWTFSHNHPAPIVFTEAVGKRLKHYMPVSEMVAAAALISTIRFDCLASVVKNSLTRIIQRI